MLDLPFEVTYWKDMHYASTERRQQAYLDRIARAFEFYESAVRDGRIRSYGLLAEESILEHPESMLAALKKGMYIKDYLGKHEFV